MCSNNLNSCGHFVFSRLLRTHSARTLLLRFPQARRARYFQQRKHRSQIHNHPRLKTPSSEAQAIQLGPTHLDLGRMILSAVLGICQLRAQMMLGQLLEIQIQRSVNLSINLFGILSVFNSDFTSSDKIHVPFWKPDVGMNTQQPIIYILARRNCWQNLLIEIWNYFTSLLKNMRSLTKNVLDYL